MKEVAATAAPHVSNGTRHVEDYRHIPAQDDVIINPPFDPKLFNQLESQFEFWSSDWKVCQFLSLDMNELT